MSIVHVPSHLVTLSIVRRATSAELLRRLKNIDPRDEHGALLRRVLLTELSHRVS